MNNLKKVAIIGAPGSGKTTLAIKLKEIYKLPVVFLDAFYRLPNWIMRDPKERDAMILEETKKDEWIIDGTFIDTLEERVKVADLIIFLDFKTSVQIAGIFKRYFSNFGKEKPDMPRLQRKIKSKFY